MAFPWGMERLEGSLSPCKSRAREHRGENRGGGKASHAPTIYFLFSWPPWQPPQTRTHRLFQCLNQIRIVESALIPCGFEIRDRFKGLAKRGQRLGIGSIWSMHWLCDTKFTIRYVFGAHIGRERKSKRFSYPLRCKCKKTNDREWNLEKE